MSLLQNPLVADFLDDMVDIGVEKWGAWALGLALVTWVLWGDPYLPYLDVIGLVFTLNLLFAFVVSVYWKYVGQPKQKYTSVMDIVESHPKLERRDNNE